MSKADETAKKLALVQARLGKTTGASKGYVPPPKPKIKISPRKDGAKGTVTIKW